MKNKIKPLITILVFLLFTGGFGIFSLVLSDSEYSLWERRKLAQVPEITATNILNGEYYESLEKYTADQFPFRDKFRNINSITRSFIFWQRDVNNLFLENGYIFKSDSTMNTKYVENFIESTNKLYQSYIKDKADNFYVSVIPAKEHFSSGNHLVADATEIADYYVSGLNSGEYIDIFSAISLESFYKTDTHWSQDKLWPVMNIFAQKMGFSFTWDYQENIISPFYGVYYGQLALPIRDENLVYLTDKYTETSTVENIQKPNFTTIYDISAFVQTDPYDVFLSGASPFIKVTSPNSTTDKSLVIFRDSFGSSIAPLFLQSYREVILVDLRYMSSDILGDYVDFEGKDVLVLYSSMMLNSSILLR